MAAASRLEKHRKGHESHETSSIFRQKLVAVENMHTRRNLRLRDRATRWAVSEAHTRRNQVDLDKIAKAGPNKSLTMICGNSIRTPSRFDALACA